MHSDSTTCSLRLHVFVAFQLHKPHYSSRNMVFNWRHCFLIYVYICMYVSVYIMYYIHSRSITHPNPSLTSSWAGGYKESISLPPTQPWQGGKMRWSDAALPRMQSTQTQFGQLSCTVQAKRFSWITVENGLDGNSWLVLERTAQPPTAPQQLFPAWTKSMTWARLRWGYQMLCNGAVCYRMPVSVLNIKCVPTELFTILCL